MKYQAVRAFGIAFCLTAAVLMPLLYGVYLLSQWQMNTIEQQAAHSESGIVMKTPAEKHCTTLLLCVVGEENTSFGLLRLDAMQNSMYYAALPAEGVLLNGDATPTLAESYAAAGPARVAELLRSTLGLSIDRYLAIPEARLPDLVGKLGGVRVGLSGALTRDALAALGVEGTVQDWSLAQMSDFTKTLAGQIVPAQTTLTPESLANVRCAFWAAWLRDKRDLLPTTLPDALRGVSASILSDISATDLYTLGDALEFLANGKAEVVTVRLQGDWNRAAGVYQFSDETLLALAPFV